MDNLMEGFHSPTYEEWRQKVEKELKGAAFDAALLSEKEGIRIEPLYTDRPPAEVEADGEDASMGNAPTSWTACETIVYDGRETPYAIVEAAYARQIICLEIQGDSLAFLSGLAGTIPLPVSLVVDAGNPPASEEELQQWRQAVMDIKAWHPFLHTLSFHPFRTYLREGAAPRTNSDFNMLFECYRRLNPYLTDAHLFTIDATVVGEAGSGNALQLACALSHAQQLIAELTERGAELFEIAHLFSFRFSISTDFFAGIAMLKAFRILWRNLLTALDPEWGYMEHPHIHVVTSNIYMTHADKHNNLLRTTTMAMSAVLGGCDTLTIRPYESPAGEHAQRMARNIHRLLQYESYMNHYQQSAEGAFYIEHLTHELAKKAWDRFVEMEQTGDCLTAITSGQLQELVTAERNATLEAYQQKKEILIGVNEYEQESPDLPPMSTPAGQGNFPVLMPFNIEQSLQKDTL